MARNEIDRAVADFNEAIKIDPQYALAYGNRGYAFQMKRDFPRAIDDYTMQIKIAPDVLAYINRGNVWRSMQNLDRAMSDYGEVVRLAPGDARGWRNRALIKLMKDDFKGGIAEYNKALGIDPKDAISWNNRGIAKRESGDRAGAIADFKKALEINSSLQTARDSLRALGVTP